MKSWTQRLLEFALSLAAVACLLTWTWQLLRPLLPVLIIGAGVSVIAAAAMHRLRGW